MLVIVIMLFCDNIFVVKLDSGVRVRILHAGNKITLSKLQNIATMWNACTKCGNIDEMFAKNGTERMRSLKIAGFSDRQVREYMSARILWGMIHPMIHPCNSFICFRPTIRLRNTPASSRSRMERPILTYDKTWTADEYEPGD
jgi:hypothetical protein